MKITVKVTKDVLERSRMCSSGYKIAENCAISLAVRDLFPLALTHNLHCNLLGQHTSMAPDTIMLSDEVIWFIRRFDHSTPKERVLMSPFSFEIEVPEYVIEKIGLSQIYKVLSESKSLEMVMHKEETN